MSNFDDDEYEKASPRPIFLGLTLFWLAVAAIIYHNCGCP